MDIQTKTFLLGLIISCFFNSLINADSNLESEIKQLRKIERVTGRAVGIGGSPGEFYILSKIFLQKGNEVDFLNLTKDENPVVRSMGIFCLAKHTKSVNKLQKHISDSGIVYYCPGGCMVTQITVGNFVRKLLLDINSLDRKKTSRPLISEDELVGLDIEILSKDSTTSFHYVSRKALSDVFAMKGISLITLSNLKEYSPNLETYKIVKAIGRLDVSPRRKNFLISCLKNKNLDQISKLAAASALTRYPVKHALNTLETQRYFLNNIEQKKWGDVFLETIQNRIAHENLIRQFRSERTRPLGEKNKDTVKRAFSNNHPLALPDFEESFYFILGHNNDDIKKIFKKSLIDMSQNLHKFNQPGNTYSDTVYALHFMIQVRGKSRRFKDAFFKETELTILKVNIQKALENHFDKH